ncbi:hypothetical protein NZK35_24195 [Stieleria sp. ICT_E10.1]|uniref:baeRF3 domain-containing protein n=1 Tax=Stieleria sedimenti TaxID=2976331 RepID=UPI00217F9AAC|nr:hypothetical protein [Stieleria sedimenti]MCS7469765.1 hypothetical protein [Stieleria sedimenti]
MSTITNELTPTRLKAGELNELANTSANPCVSILMPTYRNGPETQQNAILFKNLLGDAKRQLEAAGHDGSIVESLESLSTKHAFWQHQSEGLAVFVTPDTTRLVRVNRSLPERVFVGQTLWLLPLVRQWNTGDTQFVLSLTWDSASLFRFDGESLELMETGVLPATFHDLVVPRDPEESLQNTSHRSHGGAGATSTAIYHGHGEGEDKIAADRDQYLSLVGDQVAAAIYNTGIPLVLVATTEVAGHFEATTDVSVDARVEGSPAQWSDQDLRERVRQTLSDQLSGGSEEGLDRFATAIAQSQGSSDLSEIVAATANGRVDSLLIAADETDAEATHWNSAVVETLRQGGSVYRCEAEQMPGVSKLMAIFRY